MIGFFAIFFTISFFKTPADDKPKKTSAFVIASLKVLFLVFIAWLDFHLFNPFLPLWMTPFLSIIVKFFWSTPFFLKRFAQAIAEAPAPLTTTFNFFMSFFVISTAFINAAHVIIAVPCWSSWKTGISKIFFNFSSIIKQSGAAISSKFIPPKLPEKFFTLLIISFGLLESISKSIASISANLLNKTALPSITGFDANAPRFPIPNIADPLLITATKLPFVVYSYASSGFFEISFTGTATPGEYASAKSLFVVIGFDEIISIFPDLLILWNSKASLSE